MNTLLKISGLLVMALCCSVAFAHGDHSGGQELTIPNFKHGSGNVWVGGQPSENDLKLLAERGINNVVNLRGIGEFSEYDQKAVADKHGLNYKVLPIAGKQGVTVDNAIQFAAMLNTLEGKTLVHCASGNRVGALFALKAFFVDKKTASESLEIGKQHGMTRLEGHVKALIDKEI